MTKGIIKLESLIKHFGLTMCNNETSSFVDVKGLYRPGLELVGYYDYVEDRKAVILGNKEINFISTLDEEIEKAESKREDYVRKMTISITNICEAYKDTN